MNDRSMVLAIKGQPLGSMVLAWCVSEIEIRNMKVVHYQNFQVPSTSYSYQIHFIPIESV
jgi:hypothetical protein